MYDSDRGIEEMLQRLRPDEISADGTTSESATVSIEWLAEQMRTFVDLNPDWEDAIGRFATQLARTDDIADD